MLVKCLLEITRGVHGLIVAEEVHSQLYGSVTNSAL